MDAGFWHEKWAKNDIAFHQIDVHPMLAENLARLGLPKGARVFVSLCGKSLDMGWLAKSGYHVIGAELSEEAVKQFFEEAGLQPSVRGWAGGRHYSAAGIEIFAGDIFDLKAEMIGTVDAVYDRAALVALPDTMRPDYAAHVTAITGAAPQLLITFTYDQSVMAGPPFSIPADEVTTHYTGPYEVELLCSEDVEGGLKGKAPATEHLWLLAPR